MDEPATERNGGEDGRSRRAFMGDATLVGAGAAAFGVVGSGVAAANDGNNGNGSSGSNDVSDVDVLNYALTLEHLEAAYYNDFLDSYSEGEVEGSKVANYFARPTLQYSTYQQIEGVRDHEEAHVDALTTTINDLGGTPVEPANYEFPYSSIEEFVTVADRLEAVGVSAYAGVAPMIDSDAVLEAALSIHSVEANHQTYFQLLNLQRPAPNAFNPARSMDEVLGIANQFIVDEDGGGNADGEGELSVAGLSADADGTDANNLNDEYITYENTGDGPLDLSGWTVTDESATTYRFPDGFTLEPGAQVTLYTGSGTNTDTELYWGQATEVWNNGADTMTVANADGETVLQRSYP
ncbi:ferritin-like domain-containing protein [Halococcus sp. AFM35]|uniref:ferritin-like domain-containing protein n=1 Tax=Halococcus sp. AFM35 TaxID=3421653 RepID=UPI003EBA8EAF